MPAVVVYVEILRGLEEILGAGDFVLYSDYGDDDEDSKNDDDDSNDDNDDDDDDSNNDSNGNDSARDEKKKKKKKKNGEEDGNHPSSSRVQAMDRFLALAKAVVSGRVMLDGCYPVPEASGWYDFDRAFPCIMTVLERAAAFLPSGSPWLRREEVLMYWIHRPVGWTWAEDAPSIGSEDENEGADVWDLWSWESDSVKSDFTEDN